VSRPAAVLDVPRRATGRTFLHTQAPATPGGPPRRAAMKDTLMPGAAAGCRPLLRTPGAAAFLLGPVLVVSLGAAVVVTEAAVPPTLVLLNVLTEKAVRPAVLTQALTWNNSASAAGLALAASLAGRAADARGASAALALAPAAGLVLLVLSLVLSLAARRPGGTRLEPDHER
jgi:predicted MFS family arabinose efflux permease